MCSFLPDKLQSAQDVSFSTASRISPLIPQVGTLGTVQASSRKPRVHLWPFFQASQSISQRKRPPPPAHGAVFQVGDRSRGLQPKGWGCLLHLHQQFQRSHFFCSLCGVGVHTGLLSVDMQRRWVFLAVPLKSIIKNKSLTSTYLQIL